MSGFSHKPSENFRTRSGFFSAEFSRQVAFAEYVEGLPNPCRVPEKALVRSRLSESANSLLLLKRTLFIGISPVHFYGLYPSPESLWPCSPSRGPSSYGGRFIAARAACWGPHGDFHTCRQLGGAQFFQALPPFKAAEPRAAEQDTQPAPRPFRGFRDRGSPLSQAKLSSSLSPLHSLQCRPGRRTTAEHVGLEEKQSCGVVRAPGRCVG